MTATQKAQHRELYNQLRLAIAWPGDEVADTRRLYSPINKDEWTWDDAMQAEDTPAVRHARRFHWYGSVA